MHQDILNDFGKFPHTISHTRMEWGTVIKTPHLVLYYCRSSLEWKFAFGLVPGKHTWRLLPKPGIVLKMRSILSSFLCFFHFAHRYANKGSIMKAITDFERALENCPDHRNAKKYLCQTLVERGKQ